MAPGNDVSVEGAMMVAWRHHDRDIPQLATRARILDEQNHQVFSPGAPVVRTVPRRWDRRGSQIVMTIEPIDMFVWARYRSPCGKRLYQTKERHVQMAAEKPDANNNKP